MSLPEQIFKTGFQLKEQDFGFKVVQYRLPRDEPMRYADELVLSENRIPSPLEYDNVPDISREFLKSSLFYDTASKFGFDRSNLSLVEFAPLQIGSLAYHVIFRVNRNESFVLYIHRFPLEWLGNHFAKADFDGLCLLKQKLAEHSKITDVGVVEPITFGYLQYQRHQIPVYTTVFNPVGEELHVYCPLNQQTGFGVDLPLYKYALSEDNDNFSEAVAQQYKQFLKALINKRSKQLETSSRQAAIWHKHRFGDIISAVIRANAVVYYTTNCFPMLFQINSGDWMMTLDDNLSQPKGKFNPNQKGKPNKRFIFTLVTCRGGLKPMDEEQFIQGMVEHKETDYGVRDEFYRFIEFNPFSPLTPKEIAEIIKQTKRELLRGK